MNLSVNELTRHFDEEVIEKDDLIDLCLSEFLTASDDSEKAAFLILIGRCFRSKKEYHYANHYLDEAIKLNARTSEALFWKGCIQNNLNNTSSAASLFEGSIEADSEYDLPHVMLSVVYWQQDRFPDSKAHALQAVELNPEAGKNHFWLSEALFSLKETESAEYHLRKAVTLGFSAVADTLQKRFKIKTTQERLAYSDFLWDSFKRRKAYPDVNKSLDQLRMVISKGEISAATDLSDLHTTLSERSLALPKVSDEAISNIEKAVELAPNNAKAYFIWACLIEKRNTVDKEKIESLYAKAVELDPTNYKFCSQFAKYAATIGDSEKALRLYERTMDIYAFDPKACEYIGSYYAENGQVEKGLDLLRRASRYKAGGARRKIEDLTSRKLAIPSEDTPQEERDNYNHALEISELFARGEQQASGGKWSVASYYFQIAKEKLETEDRIEGGRLDRLLTDVYAKIGWVTPQPEGNEWLSKAIAKDPLHLGAINTLASRHLTSDPEKTAELYARIRALNPNDSAANMHALTSLFKNKEFREVLNAGPDIIRMMEDECKVLVLARKSCHTINKQLGDSRWYLAKSFEETGRLDRAKELFDAGLFREDSQRVKELIAQKLNKNETEQVGWHEMPEKFEIEAAVASFFSKYGSQEHKSIAKKVRISDQNLWQLWKNVKFRLEPPDDQIDSSFKGGVWKDAPSWFNSIRLSNEFSWEDLDDEPERDLEKVEVYCSFYVEVYFKEHAGTGVFLDFSAEGKNGEYYVECRRITLH